MLSRQEGGSHFQALVFLAWLLALPRPVPSSISAAWLYFLFISILVVDDRVAVSCFKVVFVQFFISLIFLAA
ncbi:hypothetical protein GOZ78_03060 [Agrobacterium vitis]|uniref:Secreted peptide n=1 Tax=Agrobacterium vitis TaxID=373 RepID=A0ABD6G7Q8_AGRVI|nr:hypothetical protein [Agrobacterium vitis]MUO77877.1 hypothetical protein [Agrobacterium vitis]MUO93395.1 hypothetical protein [Agrobacterium vitis]MUP04746.1 hypothetical protein [Agrobacterium vitis]MUZ80817.1 hypothetical protein [Agrobacterium vitis]MVA08998.1 hypothetical protein [Agrobacterium vitis]